MLPQGEHSLVKGPLKFSVHKLQIAYVCFNVQFRDKSLSNTFWQIHSANLTDKHLQKTSGLLWRNKIG